MFRNRIAHHEPIYHLNIQRPIDAIIFTFSAVAPELLLVINPSIQKTQDIKHRIKVLIKEHNKKKGLDEDKEHQKTEGLDTADARCSSTSALEQTAEPVAASA